MIDSGVDKDNNFYTIKSYFTEYKVNKIDYFIITHPDVDHTGNVCNILDNYEVEKLYCPNIIDTQDFDTLQEINNKISEKKISTKISTMGDRISGEDYTFLFLSPASSDYINSPYNKVNSGVYDSNDVNDISPIIYLQYLSVKFLFTGDAGSSQEDFVISNNTIGNYEFLLSSFDIQNIDFLKVSHHGSYTGSSKGFLSLIHPQNAIISVGGNNTYGHPSIYTITRILDENSNCNIYRTDYYGTISVFVNSLGQYNVVKSSGKK